MYHLLFQQYPRRIQINLLVSDFILIKKKCSWYDKIILIFFFNNYFPKTDDKARRVKFSEIATQTVTLTNLLTGLSSNLLNSIPYVDQNVVTTPNNNLNNISISNVNNNKSTNETTTTTTNGAPVQVNTIVDTGL